MSASATQVGHKKATEYASLLFDSICRLFKCQSKM